MPRSEPPQPSILLRLPDAAAALGFSRRWLEKQIAERGAPVVHIGKSVRMRRQDVEAFARDGRWPGQKAEQAGGEAAGKKRAR
jgi:excisionase family DNA binding protein